MGCGASTNAGSKYAHAEDDAPTKNDQIVSDVVQNSVTETGSSAESTTKGIKPFDTGLKQGHHWAEGSPGKDRRIAEKPWEAGSPTKKGFTPDAAEEVVCAPCEGFNFRCTFPMMVMKMETFMSLKVMKPYEEMIKTGSVFEWTPEMGKVFFLSHQWTSFGHPDPASEQLEVAQTFLGKVGEGQIRSLFATEEEWLAFHYKESNRFLQFDPVTEEQIAEDVKSGYVWLDFASVPQVCERAKERGACGAAHGMHAPASHLHPPISLPLSLQAAEAEEQRLKAIDSIPYYVDHALCFLAIVPKIEHKDLPGTYCTYKSWQVCVL